VKFILILTLCLIFTFAAAAQEDDKTPQTETVAIEQIFLAKDNGEGKAGDEAESFLTTDIPIYCVVQLNSSKPTTVKMNLVAVSVQGVKAESKVITTSYKTNGRQNRVNFTGRPDGIWTVGKYRIDIYLDDKLATGKTFEIIKSPSEIQKTTPQIDSFVKPKTKSKPRVVKQTRKS